MPNALFSHEAYGFRDNFTKEILKAVLSNNTSRNVRLGFDQIICWQLFLILPRLL